MSLEAPWRLAHDGETSLAVRHGDTPEGVRIQLMPTDDWGIGASPIVGGRATRAGTHPLVGVGFVPVAVEVRADGPDLLVRFSGPPFSQLTDREDAPEDPVLAWIRLRPRGETWRVVLDGLGVITIPDAQQATWTSQGLAVGSAILTTTATTHSSRLIDGAWQLDTTPALDHADPYPRTGITFRP